MKMMYYIEYDEIEMWCIHIIFIKNRFFNVNFTLQDKHYKGPLKVMILMMILMLDIVRQQCERSAYKYAKNFYI